MYRHAVVITPVARWVLIARGTAYSNRYPFIPSDGGLPHASARSATTLDVSRPAQRSLALRPACSPSHHCGPLHRRLQQFRYLHHCFDCYRAEPTSSRAGLPRAVDQRLFTAHTSCVPVSSTREMPMSEWIVLQQDRLPAYITWERYLANQQRLLQNGPRTGSPGVPRSGKALLTSLLVCGACGRQCRPAIGANRPLIMGVCGGRTRDRRVAVSKPGWWTISWHSRSCVLWSPPPWSSA